MVDFHSKSRYDLGDMIRLIAFLRSENGCPWDKVQTHESIRRNFIEEVYEAVEAIDAGDTEHMKEELGDVLMQVIFHTDIERCRGKFDIDDVADASCKKLVERHPNLFGGEPGQDWEEIKRRQNGYKTVAESMEHVARSLPALWRSEKILKKAANAGFRWDGIEGSLMKVDEEARELREAVRDGTNIAEELGDLLLAAVGVAWTEGIDPESALNAAADKFMARFKTLEQACLERGLDMGSMTQAELESLWQECKRLEK